MTSNSAVCTSSSKSLLKPSLFGQSKRLLIQNLSHPIKDSKASLTRTAIY